MKTPTLGQVAVVYAMYRRCERRMWNCNDALRPMWTRAYEYWGERWFAMPGDLVKEVLL